MAKKYYEGRIYSTKDFYKILDTMLSNINKYKKAKKHSPISNNFEEKIMLAVTSVNKCAMCSYFHTKKAIESGIESEEAKMLLNGEFSKALKEEQMALLFAQHYADKEGMIDRSLFSKLKETYGNQKAEVILGTIRIIMMGNAYGNAFSGFISRFKKRPPKNSSPLMEILVMISPLFFIPFIFIKNLLVKIF